MPPKRHQLFEELSLLTDEPEPQNPYEQLGLDPAFARNILREDPSGAGLQMVTGALYRVLAKRYHPDVAETPDSADKYRAIAEANDRIDNASPAALLRWAKTERAVSSFQLDSARRQNDAVMERTAQLVQQNVELGQHPQHFARFDWSQGVLLRRGTNALLLRQSAEGGVEVTPTREIFDTSGRQLDHSILGTDFRRFLRRHRAFGIEPSTPLVAYMDGTGRASLLTPGLRFIMDVTDPVTKYRNQQAALSPEKRAKRGVANYWARAHDPLLLTTSAPDQHGDSDPNAQMLVFPRLIGEGSHSQKTVWNLPMEVAGSAGNTELFQRMRHNRRIGTAALSGSQRQRNANYFGMAALSTQQLIAPEADYTVLVSPGNSLVLYDQAAPAAIATDTRIIGMIGNGAYLTD